MDWEESTGDKILLPLEEKTAEAGRPLSGPVVPGMKAECGRGGGVLEVLVNTVGEDCCLLNGAGSLGLNCMESWVVPLVDEAMFLLDRRATNSRMNGGIWLLLLLLSLGWRGGGGLDGNMGGFPIDPDGVVGC